MRQYRWISSANPLEVLPCYCERQVPVRSAPNHVCVMVTLTVILPEADRANLVASPFTESAFPAAGTGGRMARQHRSSLKNDAVV